MINFIVQEESMLFLKDKNVVLKNEGISKNVISRETGLN